MAWVLYTVSAVQFDSGLCLALSPMARNEELFQHKFVSAQTQISQVHSFLSDFVLTTAVLPKFGGPPVQSHWSRPCLPFLKLNVDGAIDDLAGRRGLGAVLRNENGELMLAVSKGFMGGFGAKATKLYVAALGLQTISQAVFQNSQIILEMDALLAVNDLKDEEPNWSFDGALIEEVKTLFHLFPLVMCTYCLRKCNQAAHSRHALLFPAFHVWVDNGPQ
ncbi:uncharacterized protein LOC133730063 [Rosa rugosa]|uniref:uncharacterized protein LOC133730063 n=1 Tax=Rosa rugosa TaxID=74645 RepID=UPI002B4118AD|nr:uncharacterized protein LOC133730063 [Rosa rugosa]